MNLGLKTVGLVALALPLAACPEPAKNYALTIETGYAKTSAGYVNSGLWTKGYLYLWDRNAKTIKFLSEVGLSASDIGTPESGGNMSASNVRGVDVKAGADVPSTVTASVTSSVEDQSTIDLTNYSTDSLKTPTVVLSNFLNGVLGGSDREIQENALLLKQAANSDSYRYLFSTRLVRADKALFTYSGKVATGAEVKIPLPNISANASATVTNNDMTKFEGKALPVLIDFSVYKLTTMSRDNATFYMFVLDPTAPPNLSRELRSGT